MKPAKKSIRLKFTITILIVSLIPFLLSVFLSLKQGKEKLLENVYSNLENQISLLINLINTDLTNVKNQVNLWSKFQVLDDILVDDVDKRVQSFIDNIHKNSGLKGIIFCVNKNGKTIASTRKDLINKVFPVSYFKENFTDLHKPKYLNKYFLKFSYPIYASFDNHKLIGYFVFLYDTDNLLKYISNTDKEFNIIFNKDKTYFIGQSVDIFNKLDKDKGFTSIYGYVIAYKKIKNSIFKDNWYMLSAVDENFLFKPIYSLNKIFLIIGISGILLIIGTTFYLVRKMVNPIENLTEFVKNITVKKDYSKTITIKSNDEIQLLADAFNHMIGEINKAFKSLEKESLERLRLFLKLTETFNSITKAEKPEDVFEIVDQQLKDFPHIKEIGFSITKIKDALNVKIKTEEINGYLYFRIEENRFSSEEERFLKSISTFVNLWLERIELMKKATESSKAKSAFIANMSHELRTPLNSIIGFAQFFQMADDIPEEYKELAKNIEISGRHLLDLINDILDFSKAEAGKIEVNKINTNIASVIYDAVNIVKPMADEKNLYIKTRLNEDITFSTDIKMFRQILLNLLSNAVKFTEEGGITIKVKKICGKLFVSVKDTGIGIEKENLKKLFQDFSQLENPMQKKYKGTGLGLSITKKYVELLGGKIKVYSKGKGKGTEFIFYIS